MNHGILGTAQYDIGNILGMKKDTLNTYVSGYVNDQGEEQSAVGLSFIKSF